jgi:hypothetical protein
VDGDADLIGPRRRRLRIAILVLVIVIAAGVALLLLQRRRARARAEAQLRAIAGELEQCLVVADGVADDALYDLLVLRQLGAHPVAIARCNEAAAAKVRELDVDELPEKAADLWHELDFESSGGIPAPLAACDRIHGVRSAVAALDGRTAAELRCNLRPSNATALDYVHDEIGYQRDGELLDVLTADVDTRTLHRFRIDGSVAAELDVTERYAVDRDDVVFVTPAHLSRWRGGKRLDGPALPDGFGQVRAWRHTTAGDVGVFFTDGGYRVQTFDDALKPVGASRVVAGPYDADVAIGPAGEVVALDDRFACTTDRTIWSATGTRVESAPIGQPLAGDATLAETDHAVAIACDDAHLYVVTDDAYEICDRARCAVARALPKLRQAAVRAHDGGAEVLAEVEIDTDRVLLDLLDPHGDGHVTLTPYDAPLGSERPWSFGGRWFVMRQP